MRAEPFQIQVGFVAVAVEGVRIEGVHDVPQRIIHVAAVKSIEFDAGLGDSPAFALRFFTFLGGERREEGVERLVAVVVPVKLAVAAQDQSRRPQALGSIIRGE